MKKYIFALFLVGALVGTFAFADVTPTPTPTATPTPTMTPTPTPTPTPTVTPTPTPTVVPSLVPAFNCIMPGLKLGDQNDEVENLQQFLSQDKSIYPEGKATGFFGSLTQKALKRLQQRLGIPATGNVDDETRPFVFPCATVHVDSPNGGEAFTVGSVMHITWDLNIASSSWPTVQNWMSSGMGRMMGLGNREDDNEDNRGLGLGIGNMMGGNTAITVPVMPMLSTVSIDLVRAPAAPQPLLCVQGGDCGEGKSMVYHIGNASVSAQAGQTSGSFDWTIPSTIPQSSDYRVRVSALRSSDVSDAAFTISGGSILPTPLPVASTSSEQLMRVRAQIMDMMTKLQTLLSQINQALGL